MVYNVVAEPVDGLATVIRVSWDSPEDMGGYVEFGPDGDCTRWKTPDIGPGPDHEALLLGLPSATEACFRIVATEGSFRWPDKERTIQTGNLPAAVPALEVPLYDEGLVGDGFFLAASGTAPALVLILDRQGRVVWHQPADEGFVSPQALPDATTGGYLYNRFSKDFSQDVGAVRRVAADGNTLEEVRTPLAHHSFELLDDGTIAWLALDVRDTEDWGPVVGDVIREVSAEGVDRAAWATWDTWEAEAAEDWSRDFYPQGYDWTHANFLSWSEARQSYTVSFRNVSTVAEIDRDGDLLRSVGYHGDHDIAGDDGSLVHFPHSAVWTERDTLLFTTTPTDTEETRAVELAFDEADGSAEVVWTWGEGEGHYAKVLGEAVRLADDNTLVNFGSEGVVVEVTPEGEIGWRLETPAGYFPGHLTFIRDLYDPAAKDADE